MITLPDNPNLVEAVAWFKANPGTLPNGEVDDVHGSKYRAGFMEHRHTPAEDPHRHPIYSCADCGSWIAAGIVPEEVPA